MTRSLLLLCALPCALLTAPLLSPLPAQGAADGGFTLAQVMGAPFPTGLTAAARAERLAWTLNERGVRNVYVAEGPAFAVRRLTAYGTDDG